MVIEESNLKFKFGDEIQAIKFDDGMFYRKEFNKLPSSKGVDIVANDTECIQLIEIKNCQGYEIENLWRTSIDNRKVSSAPRTLDVNDRDSFDIEIAKKVASTICCLYGAWTKTERAESASELLEFWRGIYDPKILRDKKRIMVILFLEGDFGTAVTHSRTKKMIMKKIQDSIKTKLSWLNCKVAVVDSNTYNSKYFKIV